MVATLGVVGPRDQRRVILAPPAASSTASTSADAGTGAPDANANSVPFHVDVTNQSYEEPRVPLVVSIDDETVVDDSFDVDDQHTVKRLTCAWHLATMSWWCRPPGTGSIVRRSPWTTSCG